jgi:hypothetical protein
MEGRTGGASTLPREGNVKWVDQCLASGDPQSDGRYQNGDCAGGYNEGCEVTSSEAWMDANRLARLPFPGCLREDPFRVANGQSGPG